jgi:transcriptional regulator with XRE-family HTH domain
MLDFVFATHQEICTELGQRLKRQRLAQSLTQKDLAERAGVALGTVKNLEGKGVSSLESTIRIVMALGLVDEVASLFKLKAAQSIAQMERAQLAERKRAPSKTRLSKPHD